ncbi:phosphatidylserine decarboxylase [Lentinula raphanica]|nr:phosphatidylserine decarboxylase [Lentinula raphanica]
MAPEQTKSTPYGGWIPADPAIWKAFFNDLLHNIDATKAHVPAVQAFQDAIESDSELVDLFRQTFLQVSPQSKIKNFDELLYCMDQIVVAAPKFQVAKNDQGAEIREPIGAPLYLLFDLLGNTSAGYFLLVKKKLNAPLKNLLNAWADYLRSPDSVSVLNDPDELWFGKHGGFETTEWKPGSFNETFECPDPTAINRGFTSWDAFFTRKFKPEIRKQRQDAPYPWQPNPGPSLPQSDLGNSQPDGPPHIQPDPHRGLFIYNACESTVYRIQTNVKGRDKFWLKGQPYSIFDILGRNDDEVARSFIGGTVYQASLSPYDYHRWHSPVNGVIKAAELIEGSYYAALPDNGTDDPRGALTRSQSWLTISATRALIYVEADDKRIGTLVFVGVGMAEISTCDITARPGQRVSAGDELGMFHYGGSSYALIFGPNVNFKVLPEVGEHQLVFAPFAGVE